MDSKEASPPPSPFPLNCHIMTVQSNIRGNDHVTSHMTLTVTPGGKVRPVWRETDDIHGLGVSIKTGQEMNINTVFSSSLHLPYLEKKEKGWVGGCNFCDVTLPLLLCCGLPLMMPGAIFPRSAESLDWIRAPSRATQSQESSGTFYFLVSPFLYRLLIWRERKLSMRNTVN